MLGALAACARPGGGADGAQAAAAQAPAIRYEAHISAGGLDPGVNE